jgi:hypothetical protein
VSSARRCSGRLQLQALMLGPGNPPPPLPVTCTHLPTYLLPAGRSHTRVSLAGGSGCSNRGRLTTGIPASSISYHTLPSDLCCVAFNHCTTAACPEAMQCSSLPTHSAGCTSCNSRPMLSALLCSCWLDPAQVLLIDRPTIVTEKRLAEAVFARTGGGLASTLAAVCSAMHHSYGYAFCLLDRNVHIPRHHVPHAYTLQDVDVSPAATLQASN